MGDAAAATAAPLDADGWRGIFVFQSHVRQWICSLRCASGKDITRRRRLQSNEQFDTCVVFAHRSQQDVADSEVFHLVLLMDKFVSYFELPKQAVRGS
jgi:hypothetical protein